MEHFSLQTRKKGGAMKPMPNERSGPHVYAANVSPTLGANPIDIGAY